MTPAERLTAAADLLDKRASEATKGPWDLDMHSPDMAGRHGWRMRGPRSLGLTGIVMDTRLTAGDAHYIALMHPEVGKALAKVLRAEAKRLKRTERLLAFGGAPLFKPEPDTLALADLVLAGAS